MFGENTGKINLKRETFYVLHKSFKIYFIKSTKVDLFFILGWNVHIIRSYQSLVDCF